MDYAMPRADQLPMFDTEISEIPSTTNPLGMRGGGEGRFAGARRGGQRGDGCVGRVRGRARTFPDA